MESTSIVITVLALLLGSTLTYFFQERIEVTKLRKEQKAKWLKQIYVTLLQYKHIKTPERTEMFNNQMALLSLIGNEEQNNVIHDNAKKLINNGGQINRDQVIDELLECIRDEFRKEVNLPKLAQGISYYYDPKENNDAIHSVAFSPCGNYVVSGSDDECIKLWNKNTGKLERKFKDE